MRTSLYFSLLIASCFIFLTSCAEDISPDLQKVRDQENAYNKTPSKETAASYVAAVSLYSSRNSKTNETKSLLLNAKAIAEKEKQDIVAAGLNNELIKQFPNDPETKGRLVELAKSMDKIGKKNAGTSLKYFVSKKYPELAAKEGIIIPEGMPEDPTKYLDIKAEQIFENAEAGKLNRNKSFEYVDACEAYVMVNPDSPKATKYLFNSAEISKTIGTFKKSLSLYDWIINNYPNDEKAPTSQFLKAFILEDNLKNIDMARENYERFLENYPDHHFADDAQFSLNNLGKTNEEIQAELEKLQKQNN